MSPAPWPSRANQNWLRRGSGLNADAVPEKSAQTIFRAADQIIRAGRADNHPVAA